VGAGLLAVSATASTYWALRVTDLGHRSVLALAVLSFGSLAMLALVPELRTAVNGRLVIVVACIVAGLAIIPPPAPGSDVWVHAAYGRIVVEHGANPYRHAPDEYPGDPFVQRLYLFRTVRPLYGPAFIATTAAVAATGRDSRLAVRLIYQLLAAGSLLVALLVLARSGVPGGDLALLALNPVVIVEIVSQGRLDVLIGLGLLAGAIAASRNRPYVAAIAIALAALYKLPVVLALAALGAWVWRRSGSKKAVAVSATGAAVIVAAYVIAGGIDAIRPLVDSRSASTGSSIWVLTQVDGLRSVIGDANARLGSLPSAVSALATLTGLALGALWAAPRLRDHVPALVVALPVAAYLLTSPYAPYWYLGWILPLVVLKRSTATAVVVAFYATMLVSFRYNVALYAERGPINLSELVVLAQTLLNRLLHGGVVLIANVGIAVLTAEAIALLRRSQTSFGHRTKPEPERVG
jgi:hypothetical protein